MAPPLLLLQDIALTFGGTPLIEQASLSVGSGERLCLVGRNGSGKSTLLKMAAGLIAPDRGQRFLQPGTTLRYLPQEPDLTGFTNTLAYVEAGLAPGDDTYRAQYLLEQLGLDGTEDPARLSGGEARRAALARLLAPEPDILLLDEPTNHLDLPVIEWLESELRSLRSALVLISHDRRFMETLSRATVWLDRGTTRRLEQGFAAFEAWRDTVLEEEERDRHKLDRRIAQENDWLRYGVTARRKRNQGRLRALHAMRQERRDARRAVGDVKMTVSEGDISGKLVIEAVNISKAYGAEPVVRDLSIRIARGDRIGIVGRNGAGKTTLINMLTGQLAPDSGTVKIGANVTMASLDQRRAGLDPDVTLRDALTGGGSDTVLVGDAPKHVMSYLKDFLFTPEQANMPIGKLSGGERGRLMLARALALPSNLLVLDEPTNDLDLETLDLLEEMIDSYSGTVILVSHDRDFLDRTVTSLLMAEGQGRWQDYAGGYTDMLAQRGAGVEATSRGNGGATGKAANQASTPRSEPTERAASKAKLSFKDKHALESLPDRMAALERDIAKLKAVLDDPDLYARDPARFTKATEAMSKAEADLVASEEEWLRLEMLREEIESGG
ncbi:MULTISPECIES: ATP-binding cassette domain-containing protein [unclassified Chelatococcus]|uniref:ABC-F family ATP-binding cassette domain-containing protein n=1 Tax=unclassified Chelatococcus TaxID=2638111 RepID=UPI001BCC0351|nr:MULTISPECIES: ATP-binding cassette domain-containing protein [unclassified Chelatococcus]CAH1653581.1 ATP-binding protein Uup [Hyphomicrobiales bacterium]MBS7740137.1 ATP-binding cassette domain-containing protein [Chelatococcus sp. HY11]MBX3545034.1 ATP-binding cassette domain-containing protein [Chelatococcus sp.]MCO5078563.1 ATP-binding cassette domain-containing protein [Chelatococcus sp.]CAH1685664.1 ATP-binding protein Uup [Hyphomicrobiales bacterium]